MCIKSLLITFAFLYLFKLDSSVAHMLLLTEACLFVFNQTCPVLKEVVIATVISIHKFVHDDSKTPTNLVV